jgi:hypothetical protein
MGTNRHLRITGIMAAVLIVALRLVASVPAKGKEKSVTLQIDGMV